MKDQIILCIKGTDTLAGVGGCGGGGGGGGREVSLTKSFPFWKGVNSKRKEFAPSKFFPFRADPLSKVVDAQNTYS